MNDQKMVKKLSQDTARVKKDLSTLVGDSVVRMTKFEDDLSEATGKAKEDLTTWVEGGVAQLSEGFDKFSGDAKESVAGAAATVKKDVGHQLRHYNARVQEAANKVPGGIGKKAAKYPWVAITIGLLIGFLLGGLLKPTHHKPYELYQI